MNAPSLRAHHSAFADPEAHQSFERHGQFRQPQGAGDPPGIRNACAKLILVPKYSPDLNPIEQVFAKLKHLLRKAAARSRGKFCTAIGALLRTYTADECANYLKNSGYAQT